MNFSGIDVKSIHLPPYCTQIENCLKSLVCNVVVVCQLMNDANVRIKLRLVYVELWNQHDLFDVSSNARQALTGFLRYRKDTLTHVHFNYAHFIRFVEFI